MVHQIDSKWHHVVLSITTMHEKLVALGTVYYDGKIHLFESIEKRKYV
jgi:hypothetical protein